MKEVVTEEKYIVKLNVKVKICENIEVHVPHIVHYSVLCAYHTFSNTHSETAHSSPRELHFQAAKYRGLPFVIRLYLICTLSNSI